MKKARFSDKNNKLRVFTWHIHGNYLYYLSQVNCIIFLPYNKDRTFGYTGKTPDFDFGDNVYEIPAEEVKNLKLDIILFQSNFGGKSNYLEDQFEILAPDQRTLPKIYLEHEPPRMHPTDTKHIVKDKSVLLVHVTHFNRLMWDSGNVPAVVIEHGVSIPDHVSYINSLEKGVVVINNLDKRGRRLGFDIFKSVRKKIPLDLVGINSKEIGGIGEIPPKELPAFISKYRFFFSPIRYTSLGLSLCEAMMVGMPIVALATTEVSSVIQNNKTGFISTDVDWLIQKMHLLLKDKKLSQNIGRNSKKLAEKRFNINRFTDDWEGIFLTVARKNGGNIYG